MSDTGTLCEYMGYVYSRVAGLYDELVTLGLDDHGTPQTYAMYDRVIAATPIS